MEDQRSSFLIGCRCQALPAPRVARGFSSAARFIVFKWLPQPYGASRTAVVGQMNGSHTLYVVCPVQARTLDLQPGNL
jgi:hypothetical protein